MRLLLACILACIPLTAQAEYIEDLSAVEFDPNSMIDPFGAENAYEPDSIINELGPYGNPYRPSSATNFEAFTSPRPYGQERNDRIRLRTNLLDPDWIRNPFGHYGNPYSPGSFNNRYGVGYPYALDSSTILYGRSWRIAGR